VQTKFNWHERSQAFIPEKGVIGPVVLIKSEYGRTSLCVTPDRDGISDTDPASQQPGQLRRTN
jgi:hypothetical protein